MEPAPHGEREQLAFLLGSLDDLERERAAGDIDDDDYQVLKDDYTARAAALLRARDHASSRDPASRRRETSRTRPLVIGAAVVALAVLAGVAVAQSAGRRDPGEVLTGGIRQSATEKLNQAGRLAGEGDLDGAVALYDEVLAEDDTNAEALTYRGWLLTLMGDQQAGLTALLQAATAHPDYPDVHAFLAIVFFRSGLVAQADRELQRLEALDPPPAIRDLTANLRAQVDAALASSTTASR